MCRQGGGGDRGGRRGGHPPAGGSVTSGTRSRQLGLVAIFTLAGAGLAAIAAALTWWSADFVDPLSGPLAITLSGAACVPELIPLALVALAGFGAALATRGVPRRLVGIVLLACGAAIAVRAALSVGDPPTALVGSLTRPADPVGAAQPHVVGPVLAIVAGLLLAAAGVMIGIGLGARRRLGARYDAPSGQPSIPAGTPSTQAAAREAKADPADVDPGDWWKALDAGADPTIDAPAVSEQPSGGSYHDPNAGRSPG
jgi:uncharacterized membrane protein (TIGR02234 family)